MNFLAKTHDLHSYPVPRQLDGNVWDNINE